MQKPINTPRAFFDQMLVPDIEALRRNPGDPRLALHASTSLHQLREWVHKAGLVPRMTWQDYCVDLYTRRPELKDIRDLASNAKHYPPTQAQKLDVGVTAMPTATVAGVEGADQAMEVHVIAKTEDGETIRPVPIILAEFEFWKKEFGDKGW